MAESLIPARVEPGDPIRATHINEVFKFIKGYRQYENGFISGAFKVTRSSSSRLDIENSVDTAYCLIENNIPFMEYDKAARKVKPGLLSLDFTETGGGVTLLEWEEGGEYLIPMKRENPDTGVEEEIHMPGVNVSGTMIEASDTYPVIGKGAVEKVLIQKADDTEGGGGGGFFSVSNTGEEIIEERFSIDNVIDLRMIPGFDPNAADIQVPYKELSSRKYRQGFNTCNS